MNRPKFCVGEEVAIRGVSVSLYDTDKTEVTKSRYFNEGETRDRSTGKDGPSGWRYQTEHQPDKTGWWKEPSLVKLPPDQNNSFESMMTKLNDSKELVNHDN